MEFLIKRKVLSTDEMDGLQSIYLSDSDLVVGLHQEEITTDGRNNIPQYVMQTVLIYLERKED